MARSSSLAMQRYSFQPMDFCLLLKIWVGILVKI